MSYAQLVVESPPSSRPRPLPESLPMKSFFGTAEPGRERSPMTSTRRRKLLFSYLPDWIITIVLAALFFSLDKVEGYKREFSLSDTSLRHTYAIHERVPNIALYFICLVAPFCLQPVINLVTIRSWWDFHNGSLGLILGLAITGSITQFVKITVGRPRPDLVDRCQPPIGAVDPTFGLSTVAICTQGDAGILRDGFRSFPSGHSSLSFAGLGFLSFYLAGKLHLFDRRGHAGKAWLALTPFAGAALVAISRTMDYRHHWHDVLIGSLLGTFVAFFSYRQYYPSLGSDTSHRPYSPRIKREEPDSLPTHHLGHQQSDSGHFPQQHQPQPGYINPFTAPPRPSANELESGNGPYANHSYRPSQDYELEGTVLRPSPGPLEEVWKSGDERPRARDLPPMGAGESALRPGSRTGLRAESPVLEPT